jgi:uncharacterized protein (DUF697 family)/predicted nucleic acid-binding protein
MSFWILDTDHVSLLLMGHPQISRRVADAGKDVAISIVTIQELFNGWIVQINNAKDLQTLIQLYGNLNLTITLCKRVPVVNFDQVAGERHQQLLTETPVLSKQRMQKDMRIAATALSVGAVGNAVINTGSSAAGAVSNAASTVGNAAVNAGGAVVGTVSSAAGAVGNAVVYTGSSAVGAASSTASAISNAAVNAGGAVVGTVSSAAGAVGYAAASTGSAVVETVANTATGIAQAGLQVTDGIGYILDLTSHSELLKSITSKLNLDWLLDIIDAVDVVKAETHVKQLKKKYPLESPSQIVDRLISEKALYVGFSGFGTSIIPGIGAGLFAVDLATTSACKAELVYQLACAYNFDLRESSRKGEAMAVFSLAFGGSYAVKAGLGLVRGVPLAGAVIGATSNSAILLVIGHVAKQFYEAKLNASISKESLERTQSDSEDYLKKASEQQNIIDQILIHVAIAGCPRKNSKEIFKELKTRGFNPTVLAKVGSELKHLPALEELIGQLENDFKKAVLGQCHVAANLDQVITPGEAKIIKKIQDSIK